MFGETKTQIEKLNEEIALLKKALHAHGLLKTKWVSKGFSWTHPLHPEDRVAEIKSPMHTRNFKAVFDDKCRFLGYVSLIKETET